MSFILNIDTAVQTASVCLAEEGVSKGLKINASQKDHAAWLQPAIARLLQEQSLPIHHLKAIAVSAGPGSYTGLRVGMATAKGLCYALNIPLIAISTLKIMAWGAKNEEAEIICPMIDARRLEVFTAIYNRELHEWLPPQNLILAADSFKEFLQKGKTLFFGNGSEKFKAIVSHPNAIFKKIETTAEQMVVLSYDAFQMKKFEDIAYVEPQYGKEFYSPTFGKI